MEMVDTPPSAGRSYLSPAATARGALTGHWDSTLPVRPEHIARDMGVLVFKRTGADFDVSGYFRYINDQPIIEYNGADPLVRQRFTIAHELGHFMLGHKDSPRDDPSMFGSRVKDPKERAANQFAAELLMPGEALQVLVQSGRMTSVEELARAFLVSKAAMGFRLSNLQLLT